MKSSLHISRRLIMIGFFEDYGVQAA